MDTYLEYKTMLLEMARVVDGIHNVVWVTWHAENIMEDGGRRLRHGWGNVAHGKHHGR